MRRARAVVTIDKVRRVALQLPRTEEHVIHGRVKFRVGSLVYVAFSRDEQTMGFAFPKELRAALVEADPDKFHLPERTTCDSTGSACGWPPSTRPRCARSSSRHGAWSCPGVCPRL